MREIKRKIERRKEGRQGKRKGKKKNKNNLWLMHKEMSTEKESEAVMAGGKIESSGREWEREKRVK